jgi:hypothetical protein
LWVWPIDPTEGLTIKSKNGWAFISDYGLSVLFFPFRELTPQCTLLPDFDQGQLTDLLSDELPWLSFHDGTKQNQKTYHLCGRNGKKASHDAKMKDLRST